MNLLYEKRVLAMDGNGVGKRAYQMEGSMKEASRTLEKFLIFW